MKRYYYAWVDGRSVRTDQDGIVQSKTFNPGLQVRKWALIYGANARQARHFFLERNVSKWFELSQ
jgi:hypothetical protein